MHQANAPSTVASPFDFPCSRRKRTSRRSRSVSSRCASQIYRDAPSRVATTTPRCSRRQVRRGVVFAHLPSSSSSSSPALFLCCVSFSNEREKKMEEEKKHVPKFSLFLFFFCGTFLSSFTHIEREQKKVTREEKRSIGVRRTRRTKKKESAQPGARTQDLSLTIPECFWCLLLGERSNQTELAELSLLSFERV